VSESSIIAPSHSVKNLEQKQTHHNVQSLNQNQNSYLFNNNTKHDVQQPLTVTEATSIRCKTHKECTAETETTIQTPVNEFQEQKPTTVVKHKYHREQAVEDTEEETSSVSTYSIGSLPAPVAPTPTSSEESLPDVTANSSSDEDETSTSVSDHGIVRHHGDAGIHHVHHQSNAPSSIQYSQQAVGVPKAVATASSSDDEDESPDSQKAVSDHGIIRHHGDAGIHHVHHQFNPHQSNAPSSVKYSQKAAVAVPETVAPASVPVGDSISSSSVHEEKSEELEETSSSNQAQQTYTGTLQQPEKLEQTYNNSEDDDVDSSKKKK